MKAIVANVLFGGIFGCLGWANSAVANPKIANAPSDISKTPIIATKLLSQQGFIAVPQLFSLVDHILTIDKFDSLNSRVNYDQPIIFPNNNNDNNINASLNLDRGFDLPSKKQPYAQQSEQIDLSLGFQSAFWPGVNKRKFWGVTTVEHWGESSNPQLNLPELDYTNSAPVLAAGSSTLTFSGGGNSNLTKKAVLDREVSSNQESQEFRGGVVYHRGIAKQVTMGVGFVYENNLASFTQLTYMSDILPIKTTVSLLAKGSQIDLHSHLNFKPAPNFELNYYNDAKNHNFDVNWRVASGLTLIARGNSQHKSYISGFKVVVQNNYLSLSAMAALDNNYNLQWKLNSQIGRFKFAYSNNRQISSSELNTNLINSKNLGFQCSAFIKYQTSKVKKNQHEFIVWGGKIHSATIANSNQHYWTVDFGYGSGDHGKGLVVNGSVALKSDLFLKLNYQEISAVSDETQIKLQLGSN
ncbi:MAG TPA: hypothetical protein V6C71_23220 [Coleofasciculaceae cyanobacterium]|jgi:hypothetical protein